MNRNIYSSVKKLPPKIDSKHLSVESKKHKSVSKLPQSQNKSASSSKNIDPQIRKLMTSNAYNTLFNRLVNFINLKQFVQQSSQYVEFHQQEVMKYIPSGHNVKRRFSFSLKNSIYSFLERDYRFLRHYYTLLQKEFPEKADHFRQEIFQFYKDTVVDRNKFDHYFASNNAAKSTQSKSQHKKTTFQRSAKKKDEKSNKKVNTPSKSQVSVLNENFQHKSNNINTSKMPNQTQISNNVKVSYPNELSKRDESIKSRLRSIAKVKNIISNNEQNNTKQKNSTSMKSQRRTTKENIKIIEDTLHEIESIYSNQHSEKFQNKENHCQNQTIFQKSVSKFPKKTYNSKVQTLIEQKDIEKVIPQRVETQAQKNKKNEEMQRQRRFQQYKKEEQQYIDRIIETRERNTRKKRKNSSDSDENDEEKQKKSKKSKKPKRQTKAKDKRNYIYFSDVFDINDPQYKDLIEMSEKIEREKQQQRKKKMEMKKNCEDILKAIELEKNRKFWRPYNNSEKKRLTAEEKQIVDLFPEIDSIGDPQDFQIDRQCAYSHVFGEVNGYLVESIAVQSLNKNTTDNQIFKALHLTKLKQTCESEKNAKLSIKQLTEKIPVLTNVVNTLLLINK